MEDNNISKKKKKLQPKPKQQLTKPKNKKPANLLQVDEGGDNNLGGAVKSKTAPANSKKKGKKEIPNQKTVNSKGGRGSFSFLGRGSFSRTAIESDPVTTAYDSIAADAGEDDFLLSGKFDKSSRADSVNLHRQQHQSLTNSLQLDIEIFSYLQTRPPSLDDIPDKDIPALDEAEALALTGLVKVPTRKEKKELKKREKAEKKRLLKEAKAAKKKEKAKSSYASYNEEGGTRVVTMVVDKELERRDGLKNKRQRRGFFGSLARGFSFFLPTRGSIGGKILNRMSFGSFQETNAEEIRGLLKEKEDLDKKKAQDLMRKDSGDTELSDDPDVDTSLLVTGANNNSKKKIPKQDELVGRDRESSRLSKIFETSADPEPSKEEQEALERASAAKTNKKLEIIDDATTSKPAHKIIVANVSAAAAEEQPRITSDEVKNVLMPTANKTVLDVWDDSDDEEKIKASSATVSVSEESPEKTEGDAKIDKKEEFIGSAMTQSSTKLARVKLSGDSDERIREEKNATVVNKAFALNQDAPNPEISNKVKVVNTASRKLSIEKKDKSSGNLDSKTSTGKKAESEENGDIDTSGEMEAASLPLPPMPPLPPMRLSNTVLKEHEKEKITTAGAPKASPPPSKPPRSNPVEQKKKLDALVKENEAEFANGLLKLDD